MRTFALLACGFGCLIGFARICSSGYWGYLGFELSSSHDLWYGVRVSVELGVLALLGFAGWTRRFSVDIKTLALACACAIASAIMFAVGGAESLGVLVAVLGGVSLAVLLFVWMLLLALFPRRVVIAAVLAGLVLAGIIVEGLPYLGQDLALVAVVVAAFVASAAAALLDPGLASCASDGPLSGTAAGVPWLTVVMFVGCGFFSSVLYGVSEYMTWLYDWKPNLLVFELSIAAAIVSTAVIMLRSRTWMQIVWVPLFALVVLAVVFSCLPSRMFMEVAVGFMMASVFCANSLIWIVFPALFASLEVPRAFSAAALLMLSNTALGSIAGDALGEILPRSMQNLGSVAGLLAIVLAIVLAVTVVSNRGRIGIAGAPATDAAPESAEHPDAPPESAKVEVSEHPDAPPEPSRNATPANPAVPPEPSRGEVSDDPADTLKAKLDVLVERHGLTPRESEVVFYTVQGFSCAYIADKLVVSDSTVRFHQRNIYRKFGVHSRNELIEAVYGEEDSYFPSL